MLQDYREKEFTPKDARLLNPLQLALIGDAVYELFVENYILANNIELTAHKIHVKAIGYVKAKSQSMYYAFIRGRIDRRRKLHI